jgi:hypothetical protein
MDDEYWRPENNAVLSSIEEVISIEVEFDTAAENVLSDRNDPEFRAVLRTAMSVRMLLQDHPEIKGVVWEDTAGMRAYVTR